MMVTNNTGSNSSIEVYVDDGNFTGSNIIFNGNGRIQLRTRKGYLIPLRRFYFQDRWYRIKFIINIPREVYNIHIDDHLESINVKFTRENCSQIKRLIIRTSGEPAGFIDDVEVRRCVKVPEDFPTIQQGIDAASPDDIVFVASGRTYFECV